MTQEQIHELETKLWDAADQLRASSKLTAAEYKDPVLGLVLLRFAQNRYEEAKPIVEKNLPVNPRTGKKREATANDYLSVGAMKLPEEAKYDYLANLPASKDIAKAINDAMKLIEAEYPDLAGILPKNYQEFEKDLLQSLIRVFNEDAVKKATGDVFGRIYEYFLMKFSMQGAGAQEGGEFFTPPSLVQLIVNFIEPIHGIIHDPACGSGGMFVQTGYFVRSHSNKEVNEAITVKGTEQKTNNTKLAKMNLAIHGIEGKIIESNSFYSDPHNLFEKCDFVMANPPFNVSKIDKGKEFVKTDKRLPFGLPKADNGNYMWMQYFYSYLNKTGRAGFVMASSATDAGNSEAAIREKLIATKHIDCIVAVGNNFFYTRSLPCHLWFFDKGKSKANADKILMIDARNVKRKVTSTINDFSPGQLLNLTTIMKLYRAEKNAFKNSFAEHQHLMNELLKKIRWHFTTLVSGLNDAAKNLELKTWQQAKEFKFSAPENFAEAEKTFLQFNLPIEAAVVFINKWQQEIEATEKKIADKKVEEKEGKKQLQTLRANINAFNKPIVNYMDETREYYEQTKQAISDWKHFMEWFPDGNYQDIEGLCKIVSLDEIKGQEYSLTPGRYVGVPQFIDETFDYKTRIKDIKRDLKFLTGNADTLSEKNFDYQNLAMKFLEVDFKEKVQKVSTKWRNFGEALPFIGLEHIERDMLHLNSVASSEEIQSDKTVFTEGDILFGTLRPYFRKVWRATFDGVCSTDITVVKTKDEKTIDQVFLFYFIANQNFIDFASAFAQEQRPRVNWKDLVRKPFHIPEINNQRKIASILSAYDDLIENNLQRIKLLEEMAQINFNEWFANGRKWKERNLGSLVGHEIGGGWGEESKSNEFSEAAFVIRGTDINDIPVGKLEDVPFRFHKKSNLASRKLQDGDIVFEVSGGSTYEGVAKTLLITDEMLKQFDGDVMCASFCKLMRPVSRVYSNFAFLFLRFLREIKRTEVFEIRSASNIVNYNWTAFLKFQKVKVPDEKTLEQFNEIIDPIYKQVYNLGHQNRLLKEARDILLPRLMIGMIEV